MRKLVYFVASTIDGFIAGPDGSVDHFPVEPDLVEFLSAEYPETLPGHVRSAIGLDAPNRVFDTVLMGRNTYQPALDSGIASPYPHLHQIVFSRSLPSSSGEGLEIVSEDPVAVVRRLKLDEGRDLWLAGGGDLAGQVFDEVDELLIKLNPLVAGSGTALASRAFNPVQFMLASARPLPGGVVVLRYTR